MSEQLRPEGIPVVVDDVVLTTPGLTGTVTVHPPASEGMRAAEDSTEQFRAALAEAHLTEQLTVEIAFPEELDDAGGTRASGGDGDITVEVPAPGTDMGQVLLYAAEDGSLTWHLPDDIEPDLVPSRGGERRTYRVPRAVVTGAPTDSQTSGQRGILGALGSKLLKVLVFPLVDPVLGRVGDHFASRWEEQHRRNLVRWFSPVGFRDLEAPAFTTADWGRVRGGAALLFLHGTFSQAHRAFPGLPDETMAELHRRYDGRVFAVDHHTVSATPDENVAWLAKQLTEAVADGPGGPVTLDVVCHSRGGLVGRALAARGAELGLGEHLKVRTLVMVGAPNAGTVLAHKEHLSTLLDRITDLVQFAPGGPVTDVVGVVLAVLKQLAVGAFGGLDGIMSMNPDGPYLPALNSLPLDGVRLCAIASNYEPAAGSPLLRVASNKGVDIVFGNADNDLVVPTNGVFEVADAPGFPIEGGDRLVLGGEVTHGGYFRDPAVNSKLLEWLPG
ncbi:alpha/beta hydrolase [Knoellia locipacati]|uniref:esterase/lipase family protein n=1 Tax=Knoellia locipacati TaxID=882824 RepID=UPI00384C52D2